jgi:hypothetical protein
VRRPLCQRGPRDLHAIAAELQEVTSTSRLTRGAPSKLGRDPMAPAVSDHLSAPAEMIATAWHGFRNVLYCERYRTM